MRFSRATLLLALILCTVTAEARILARVGKVYGIVEEDFVTYMQRRTREAVANGEIDKHRQKILAKARKAFWDPDPVAGVSAAMERKTYHVDPGVIITEDIRDLQGNLIAPAGTYVNALDTFTLPHGFLFFDANDDRQKRIAREIVNHYGRTRVRVILVGGGPAKLENEWKMPVYFDQGGYLVGRLNLTSTPAFVTQDERRLRVDILPVK